MTRRELLSLAAMAPPKSGDSIESWASARVRPATPHRNRHSIHAYFNTCPESPDSRWLVYYTSATPDGHEGDVRALERATGREVILARGLTTEDAHRAACQQWIRNGRAVAYHDFRTIDGAAQWVVCESDLATQRERVLARGRMVGWGQPAASVLPLYGPHYLRGVFRDVELLNLASGRSETAVTADAVSEAYPELMRKTFGDATLSTYFPILAPGARRVVFKMAAPGTGTDFRTDKTSVRETLIGYDLAARRMLFARPKWGHPAWFPDGRRLVNQPNIVIDSDTGKDTAIPGLPRFPGSHPSVSPGGGVFASDSIEGGRGDYRVVAASVAGGRHETVHRFDNSRGAKSWRPSHPHPVFSADGRRLYFNVNSGPWTELYVAEVD